MRQLSVRSWFLSLFAIAALAFLFFGGCTTPVEASNNAPPPKVSVAVPLAVVVADSAEYVARTVSPEAVEIRSRVSGPIVKTTFHEGDLVAAGTLLFVIDPRPYEVALSRAKAELASVRADRNLATKNLERAQSLHAASAIAARELDQQAAQVDQLTAREAVAQAAVAAAQLELDFTHVRSPIAGRVGRRLITLGNLVGPTTPTPLATVVSVNPLHVYLDLEASRGLALGRSKNVEATVTIPGEGTDLRRAAIDFVDNHVDTGSDTVQVRAVLPNADGHLSHGMFARVRVPLAAPQPALLVSDRAVATDQDRRFLWIVDKDGKVEYRNVTLGPLHEGYRVIKQGLQPTDRVIVRGLQRVRAGSQVTAETIAMSEVDSLQQQAAR